MYGFDDGELIKMNEFERGVYRFWIFFEILSFRCERACTTNGINQRLRSIFIIFIRNASCEY